MPQEKSKDGGSRKKRAKNNNDEPPRPFVELEIHGEHKRAVSAVALAPGRLNRTSSPLCASASADGTVKFWDLSKKSVEENGSEDLLQATQTLVGHSRGINDVTWSNRGGFVATASDDKTLRLWDAETADALVEFRGHSNFVFCTKFNPQGNLLVSGGFDETVKLWDVRTGDCVSTLPAHSDPVTGVDFNRDGSCVVSGSHDGLLRIWDTATGECLKTIYAHGNPPVSNVQYSPNGKYVLAGTLDSKLRLWHMASKEHTLRSDGKCTKTYQADEFQNSKYCVAGGFVVSNPKRQCIVTGSETGSVVLFDIQTRKVHQVLKGHSDAVLAVSSHDSMELLASGGMTQDKTVRFWKPKSEQEEEEEAKHKNNNKSKKMKLDEKQ